MGSLSSPAQPIAPNVFYIPTGPASTPTQSTPAVSQAGTQARSRLSGLSGSRPTLLTGGSGLTDEAKIGRKTLLGQ
jgi:hypothetical protein